MILDTFWRRICHFVQRDRAAADLQDEVRLHVDLRAEQLRNAGATADDALYQAQRTFGNPTLIVERGREASGFMWLDEGLRDFRFAVRRLRHRPGFAFAVIGVMALGTGATTAMFSAVDAAMLRPLPFTKPSELVWLRDIQLPFDPGNGVQQSVTHMLDVRDVEGMKELFSSSATYAAGGLNVSDADRPVRANAGVVTADFFSTLGIFPERGRVFSAAEGRPGAAPVAIVSNRFWQEHLGGRDIADAGLSLNGVRHQVIGVMPRGFGFPRESDVWIPMSVPVTFATFGAFRGFLPSETIARLAPGVSVAKAAARLNERWQRALTPSGDSRLNELSRNELAELRGKGALVPFQEELVGDKRAPLLILLGATGLLLLIACANVTNLLLSQASTRRREMALREVLGATRGRLVRQLLVESVLLALTGASCGVAAAPAVLGIVSRLLPPALAEIAPARIDVRVLLFAVTLALVTGIVFGLWPALGNASMAPDEIIKSGGGHGSTAGKLGGGRRFLVVTELGLTIVLLVTAGLLQRSFKHVTGLDAGMNTQQVATLELSFRSMPQAPRLQRLNDIMATIAETPGVIAAGSVNDLPLRGGGGIAVNVGVPGAAKDMTMARYLMASSGYFEALGIRLLDGRIFLASDDSLAPRVVIVSVSMARHFWPGRNPIGQTFELMHKPATVVGVVADVREASLETDPLPQMYFPIAQQTPSNVAIVARSSLPPAKLLALLTTAVHRVDRTQAVYHVRMMEDVVGASVTPRRTNMLLISVFAGLALLVSALGVYAVVAYGVAQRARELGIRAALGAGAVNLVSLVAGELMWVALAGVAAGLGAAWALARLVSTMLYGVSPHDPATYLLVPLTLLVPAAIAAIIPAYRAAQVDAAIVLRMD